MIDVVCVGLGSRGKLWVNWCRQAGANVVGVVERDVALLSEQGGDMGFNETQQFTSVTDAIKSTGVKAVVVCTPNWTHAGLVEECIDNGVHVLVEKPVTEDLPTAVALAEKARSAGIHVVVAQQYRYSPAVQKMREIVTQGDLGPLSHGLIQFYRWRPSWGMKLPILLNQSVHHFDAMRVIVGHEPVSCSAHLWNPAWNECDGPTVVEATFAYDDGTRLHYSGNYTAKGAVTPFDGLWRWEGEGGQLVYDGERELVLSRGRDEREAIPVAHRSESDCEVALFRDFAASVTAGHPAPTRIDDNLGTLAMVFAIVRSAEQKREVTMAEVMGT